MDPQDPKKLAALDFNCVFCAIAAQRAPAAVVYESADALAFLDIRPIVDGHVLIIPKRHCRNIFDIDDTSGAGVMHAARIVSRAMRQAFRSDGLTLFQASERAGGQDVFHFHFHLFPRFRGDGLMSREGNDRVMAFRPRTSPTREELTAIAEKIRSHVVEETGTSPAKD